MIAYTIKKVKKILAPKLIICSFCIILFSFPCLIKGAESKNSVKMDRKGSIQVKTAEVVKAQFGSGQDKIGVVTPSEANPEGPMSFALNSAGEIYILDQVNNRVQVFKEGKRTKTIVIPKSGYDEKGEQGPCFTDIDLLPDGNIVLLDVCCHKAIYIIDPQGKALRKISTEGLSKNDR